MKKLVSVPFKQMDYEKLPRNGKVIVVESHWWGLP